MKWSLATNSANTDGIGSSVQQQRPGPRFHLPVYRGDRTLISGVVTGCRNIRPPRPFRRRTAGLVRHFRCLDHGPVQEEIELTPCESEGLSGPLTPPLPSPHFSAAGARWGCADLRSQGRRLARVREAYGACGRGDCHDLGGDGEWWGWLGSSDGLPGSAVGKVRRKKGRMGRRTRRGGKELERGEEVMIC